MSTVGIGPACTVVTSTRTPNLRKTTNELTSAVPLVPVTVATALRSGRIDGESRANGVNIPLSDLLIGVTASISITPGQRITSATLV